jgi:hypothetical protein
MLVCSDDVSSFAWHFSCYERQIRLFTQKVFLYIFFSSIFDMLLYLKNCIFVDTQTSILRSKIQRTKYEYHHQIIKYTRIRNKCIETLLQVNNEIRSRRKLT